MKEKWTYKKLGEVCTIERGGSPRPINEYITDDPNGLNWIKIGDAKEGSKYITSTKEKIKPEGLKKTRLVHKGDFILSNSMSFGKPYILDIDGCIHDGWLVIHDDNGTFDKSYLYYLLGSPNMYKEFQRLAVGGVVNNLNSEIVRNVVVPVPPIETQSRIVSELDLLQSIIDKQQAQLKELDTLAQAVFYDMFGDPVENEKGWEVKKLGDFSLVGTGSTPIREKKEYYGGDIPWVKTTEVCNCVITTTEEYITQLGVDNSNCSLYPPDTILMAMYGQGKTRGQIAILGIAAATNQACAAIQYDKKIVEKMFLYRQLLLIYNEIRSLARGGNQANLNLSLVKSIRVIIPPLSIQQSFAAKIEAIEKQKSAIGKCIEETQKLFDYTMGKYFG